MTDRNASAGADAGDAEDALRVSLQVEIPSDVRYIERVVEIVRHQCASMCFDAQHCTLNVPVALSEALANAILRGNGEDPEKQVTVRASLTNAHLVLEVRDEGSGFDLERCTVDVSDPDNLEREDGRGLFLMRSLMHHVEQFDDGGNVVRLTLRRGAT
ncbi:MAG: ATP-binding protein [Gemmatimonadaceae bacterium]|nr:ATP-binding protein [Gemmatimonadaceae bacterium]